MIKSRSASLHELLQLGHFLPAQVQREYQWKTEQTKQLLDDIFGAFQLSGADPGETTAREETRDEDQEAGDGVEELNVDVAKIAQTRATRQARRAPDEYFLGGVILLQAPRAPNRYFIYDGLQRLTTISLLLAKLRDSWRDKTGSSRATIAAMLFDADAEPRVQVRTSGRTLVDVLNARAVQRRDLTEGDYRMREAMELFASEFAGWSDARRAAFLSYLSTNVRLTVTEVDDRSLAYQMFVCANARGLSLAVGDILKGQIVEHTSSAGATAAQIAFVADTWRSAQLRLRKGFDDFVFAVEMLRYRPLPEDRFSPGERLLEMFDGEMTAGQIQTWVTDQFQPLAGVFEKTRAHFGQQSTTGCDLRFRQLSFLGWKEWHPFYLALGIASRLNAGEAWDRRIASLQRACYVIELLDWSPRKRRQVFLDAIAQLESRGDPFSGRPKGGEYGKLSFSRKLKDVAAHNLRRPLASEEKRGAIVRWLETLHWGASVPRACTDDASVEHVLPRTAIGEWERNFNEDERERLTNRLGNLCIIPKEMNLRIGNSPWTNKKGEYERLAGRFKGAQLALETASTTADQSWSAATIEQLTEALALKAERALQLRPTR